MYGFAVLFGLFLSLLFIGMSLPLIQRRVKRNLIYGFRTPKTLSDDSIWYPANEYAGRKLFNGGVIIALATLILDFVPGLTVAGYAATCAAIMFFSALWMTISTLLYIQRL